MEKQTKEQQYSAGVRLRIRDAEWFVKKVEPAAEGGQLLHVRGITSPVAGRDQIFWTEAERPLTDGIGVEPPRIEVIRPENTELELDTSSHAITTRLRIESVLRHNPVTSNAITISRNAAMDVMNYQLLPAWHALNSDRDPRARVLIADAVGLGKTLEAGILLSELMVRGSAKRVLVVTLKSMMSQFQKEMWCRFSIPLVRLDSAGLQRIRSDIPSHHNPFNYYDKTIVSIDTLKQDNLFRSALRNARWDVIVIDEAHNVAARGKNQRADRARLAEELARQCDHMILLSATPHDGSKESFASLMSLLDPLAIADPQRYTPEDIAGLYERRFKKDVAEEIARNFPERELVPLESSASLPEVALHNLLAQAEFEMDKFNRGGSRMFKTTLVKALLSSPIAFAKTIENRISRVKEHSKGVADIPLLEKLLEAANAIGRADFSKYQLLVSHLRAKSTGWSKTDKEDRLVIFTERIETAKFLLENLHADLGLDKKAVAFISGQMRDTEIMAQVESFGQLNSPLRILIASDVASEGINLHHCAHRLFHFDIPWSLITFQQRNGRVDRYGQDKKPIITFLLSSADGTDDDKWVLRHILQREAAAHDNIGDPGQLMELYDVNAEEDVVRKTYERVKRGEKVEEAFDSELSAAKKEQAEAAKDENGDFDVMALLDGTASLTDFGADSSTPTVDKAEVADMPTLFPSESDYLGAGLEFMNSLTKRSCGTLSQNRSGLWELEFPNTRADGLRGFCRHVLPYELRREIGLGSVQKLVFTTDAEEMQKEVKNARKMAVSEDEDDTIREAWPETQYLWPLNPVSGWITDNVNAAFGSRSAPVLKVPGTKGEISFLMLGQVPNEHGEPLVQAWYTVRYAPGKDTPELKCAPLADLLAERGLESPQFANATSPGEKLPEEFAARLAALRKSAVEAVCGALPEAVEEFRRTESPRDELRLSALKGRYEATVEQLELKFDGFDFGSDETNAKRKETLREKAKRQKEEAYKNFSGWVTSHRRPTDLRDCQIVAAFISI